MRVVSLPIRLRLAVASLVPCIALAAFETALVSRAPSWGLPWPSIFMTAALTLAVVVTLSHGLLRGRRIAFRAFTALAIVWCGVSAWMAIRLAMPSLGFFTLSLGLYLTTLIAWVRREISRSFFDPDLAWYQGLPKPIPSLACRMKVEGNELEFKVSRIDKEGAFVFRDRARGKLRLTGRSGIDMTFVFRDRKVACRGLPVRLVSRGSGAGLMFEGMSADARKELGDFVEELRGEGYVH